MANKVEKNKKKNISETKGRKKMLFSSPQKTWWGKAILIIAMLGMALLPLIFLIKLLIDL